MVLIISVVEDLFGAKGTFGGILTLIGIIGALVLHALWVEKFYHALQTYLYVRINLGTKIYMRDARYLTLLFAPSDLGHWYPMKGIRDLPKDIRRQALMQSAKNIYRDNGLVCPEPEVNFTQAHYSPPSASHGTDAVMAGFSDLVAMLCKLAKADNQISEQEVDLIEAFFSQTLNLTEEQRKTAISYFNEARSSNTTFEAHARRFMQYHRNNHQLLESVCTLLTNLALADGELSAEEDILINETISIFETEGRAYHHFKDAFRQKKNDCSSEKEKQYAKVMGLDGELSHEKICHAYRRLAKQYHPDRVAHLGDKIKDVAEHQMKLINEAYQYLRSRYASAEQSSL
jgi:DnaJ like chaperone protein